MKLVLEGGPAAGQTLTCDGLPPYEVQVPHSGWTHTYRLSPGQGGYNVSRAGDVVRVTFDVERAEVRYRHEASATKPLEAPGSKYETPAEARERLRATAMEQ